MSTDNGPSDNEPADQRPRPIPGFARGNLIELMDVIHDEDMGWQDLPAPIEKAALALGTDIASTLTNDGGCLGELTDEQRLEVFGMAYYAVTMGFAMAAYRYAPELANVPELSRWGKKRDAGAAKGRQAQKTRKDHDRGVALAMLNAGEDVPAIAKALGVHTTTVYRWIKARGI